MNDSSFVSQKIAILADVQNLYHSARQQYGGRVRFDKLIDGLKSGRSLIRAMAYVVQKPDVPQSNFLDALEKFGFDLRVKEMKMRQSTDDNRMVPSRTSWEVGLSLDAVELCQKVDSIIVVSGDGCYVPLVHYLQAHGCRAEVCAFESSVSAELMKTADRFISIPREWTMPEKREKVGEAALVEPSEATNDVEAEDAQPPTNVSRLGVFGKS